MVGILDDFDNRMTLNFKEAGDLIFLIGKQQDDIASSEYLHKLKKIEYSPAPYFDIDEELAVQNFVAGIIKDKLIQSAHDISEGGLAITVLESGFTDNLGFSVSGESPIRKDAFWFGEAQGRVVVSCTKPNSERLQQKAKEAGIAITELGTVTGGNIEVNGEDWGNIHEWKEKYETAIEKLITTPLKPRPVELIK
jgi:phosphoribosylformylglycinamidine synthase